jgi:L-serine dehydratase
MNGANSDLSSSGSPGPTPWHSPRIELTPAERNWPQRHYSILDDVLGPVGHGPSSSHTIAPQAIGYRAQELLGGTPDEADVELYNSFATTGDGHCTPTAITAGLLGLAPSDHRMREAITLAEVQQIPIRFHKVVDAREHPNTAVLSLRRADRLLSLKAISIGGGNWTMLSCVERKQAQAA